MGDNNNKMKKIKTRAKNRRAHVKFVGRRKNKNKTRVTAERNIYSGGGKMGLIVVRFVTVVFRGKPD